MFMQDPYFNQCILCNVTACKFHSGENVCGLGKILVANRDNKTTCASFEKK